MSSARVYRVAIGALVVTVVGLAVAVWRLQNRIEVLVEPADVPPGGRAPAAPAFLNLSYADALQRADREGKPVMVFFCSDGSGPATHMEATTWRSPRVLAWARDHTLAVRVDADREPDLAVSRGIDALPVTLFARPDGSEIGRVVGQYPPNEFIRKADELVRRNR